MPGVPCLLAQATATHDRQPRRAIAAPASFAIPSIQKPVHQARSQDRTKITEALADPNPTHSLEIGPAVLWFGPCQVAIGSHLSENKPLC